MAPAYGVMMPGEDLKQLYDGQPIVYSGNRVAVVSAELAAAFVAGDSVIVDPESGEILHIPREVATLTRDAVADAADAFAILAACDDDQITAFFGEFADRLADDKAFAPIAVANATDVEAAQQRGRSTTRLLLDEPMRNNMVAGLRTWAEFAPARDGELEQWQHDDWSVSARRAPLGVVGFVFEGRPNVFADAAGVIRSGNTAVFRIGSDALGTATAIMDHAARPALTAAGLPSGALTLLNSAEHAAGWSLFCDQRLALAVARGSGRAVAQLGAVARLSGINVSLHGTGGAWLLVDGSADPQRIVDVVSASLDRKVCNTLNTVCIPADAAPVAIEAVLSGVAHAAERIGTSGRVHATRAAMAVIESVAPSALTSNVTVQRAGGAVSEPYITEIADTDLGIEWEWERSPEVSIHVVDTLADAVRAFNDHSPRFVVSVVTTDRSAFERVYATIDAPFVGDGMSRWVDGQFALDTPELGLSNWQAGRLLGRGGILAGDSVFTIRYRAEIPGNLRR